MRIEIVVNERNMSESVVGKKCNPNLEPEPEIDGNVPNRKSFIVDIF
jgi:hypothetical protein